MAAATVQAEIVHLTAAHLEDPTVLEEAVVTVEEIHLRPRRPRVTPEVVVEEVPVVVADQAEVLVMEMAAALAALQAVRVGKTVLEAEVVVKSHPAAGKGLLTEILPTTMVEMATLHRVRLPPPTKLQLSSLKCRNVRGVKPPPLIHSWSKPNMKGLSSA